MYAEQEIFSLADLVKIWTPDGISKSPAIFDPLKPVSYTHLDVYKRQAQYDPCNLHAGL